MHARWIPMLSLVAALFLAPLGGCEPSSERGESRRTIAVIPKGTMHVFWKSVQAGALLAGEDYDVEIVWKGPLREDDREDQIKVVEDMITRRVDGIVLAPLDDAALRRPVSEAMRSGIPVVIIDSDLKGDEFVSFVATDNYQGGRLAAQALAEAIGGQGKVMMLRYQEGSASTMNREQGFLDEISENHPDVEIVSSNQYGGATVEEAQKVAENLFGRFEENGELAVDGIFASNESCGFAMLRALQGAGHAGKVKYVCFDSSDTLNQALVDGEIAALVVQRPVRMAYMGVQTLLSHLDGEPVPERVDTGAVVVTRSNMDEPEIQALLTPLDHVEVAVKGLRPEKTDSTDAVPSEDGETPDPTELSAPDID